MRGIDARDHGGDVLAGTIQFIVDDIRHKDVAGGGDAHHGAAEREVQDDVKDHHGPHNGNLPGVTDSKEQNCDRCYDHTYSAPGDDRLLAAELPRVLGAYDSEQDRGQHTHCL